MTFENRDHAGRLLGSRLGVYAGQNPLILAIPRGGLPIGRAVADHLGGELDVVLVHKLRSPDNPEFAIGAVAEDGHVYLSQETRSFRVEERYLREEKAAQLEALKRRRALYTPVRPPVDPHNRVTIVVDDGLATGFTMIAALRATRMRRPARLVAAVPVAPSDSLRYLQPWANEIVCLETHEDFGAVGQYYDDFAAVTDEEAVELLKRSTVPAEPSKNA
ncbi:MAG TPA: phosphoribosyltransferase family protein [Planctomycetota bacterium]|nr:phosphoribosyltransferase family protein [Planctomycetota bacterium]